MSDRHMFGLKVPMKDGIHLDADVYLAEPNKSLPTIVTSTPYNKNTDEAAETASRYLARGYHFAWVDVRGRGDSEGEFVPYHQEGPDGYDTIEWMATQDWCDGQVITWGASYAGVNQWYAAIQHPPSLKAVISHVAPSDPFRDRPTGTRLPMEICWFRIVHGRMRQNVETIDWEEVYWKLPLQDLDLAAGFRSSQWREFLRPPSDEEYWSSLYYQDKLQEASVPAMHITGWYDDVQPGCIQNFQELCREESSARTRQRLIIGPWGHPTTRPSERGFPNVTFGDNSDIDLFSVECDWLDFIFKDVASEPPLEERVQYYLMGSNEWRWSDSWPPNSITLTSFFLSSEQIDDPSTSSPSNLLNSSTSATPGRIEYTSDPATPVPFITEPVSAQIGGPDDYRSIRDRSDVLAFSSEPLENPIPIAGLVEAELWVATDGQDSDFMVMLQDIHPDGTARRLCDGMVRLRYREGMPHAVPVVPGEVYQVVVDLWNIAHVFQVQHRIGVQVSSSAFPKFDRNMQSGRDLTTDEEPHVARNSVHVGGDRGSRVVLPILPE